MSAIVALTAQSTTEVRSVHEDSPHPRRAEVVFDDIERDAAKTGMLFSTGSSRRGGFDDHPVPLVVDPVMVASGAASQGRRGRGARRQALPLAAVVTPNLHEPVRSPVSHIRRCEPRGAGRSARSEPRP
jgi:hydroxymethylpyrimidine/phosphomethylpyrimidine kinase